METLQAEIASLKVAKAAPSSKSANSRSVYDQWFDTDSKKGAAAKLESKLVCRDVQDCAKHVEELSKVLRSRVNRFESASKAPKGAEDEIKEAVGDIEEELIRFKEVVHGRDVIVQIGARRMSKALQQLMQHRKTSKAQKDVVDRHNKKWGRKESKLMFKKWNEYTDDNTTPALPPEDPTQSISITQSAFNSHISEC